MTGPEHYQHAEQLLAFVARCEGYDTPESRELVAVAQVHATLALTATLGRTTVEPGTPEPDRHPGPGATPVAGNPNPAGPTG